jgi:diacylglycerol kinase (ATP)
MGLKAAFRYEAAFRQEVFCFFLLLPVAVWLGRTAFEVSLLIASLLFLLIVELLNSAIEITVDRIGSEINELSGRAKDLGSAAVLLTIVLTLCVWSGVIWSVITEN